MRLALVRWLHSLPLALWCDVIGTAHMQEAHHRAATTVWRDKSLPATNSALPRTTQDSQGPFILSSVHMWTQQGLYKGREWSLKESLS